MFFTKDFLLQNIFPRLFAIEDMCTLTYIPLKEGFVLTHNRDERMDRPTSKYLKQRDIGEHTLYYPEDQEAFGTWIASSTQGTSACLMNGGSETYERKDEYRHSRGLVVLDLFRYDDVLQFYREYNFHGLEPFTLLAISPKGFWKITHNEGETKLEDVDPQQPQIWSSTTLYTQEVRHKREKWFTDWLGTKPSFMPDNVRNFHKSAGEGDEENDLVMSRWGKLKTLSVTQVVSNLGGVSLIYEDFIHEHEDRASFFAHV